MPLPDGVFKGRALTAVNRARAVFAQVEGWAENNTLDQRREGIAAIVRGICGDEGEAAWRGFAADLPVGMTLQELRDFLWYDSDEQQASLLEAVMKRLNQPIPEEGILPPRVRVMTMHGAKGLSARAVFIPGLEEEIFPGPRRQPYPGLILEAARLLYVSITRARATCVLSYAERRMVYGQWVRYAPSRFAPQLNGAFVHRMGGLTAEEVREIADTCAVL